MTARRRALALVGAVLAIVIVGAILATVRRTHGPLRIVIASQVEIEPIRLLREGFKESLTTSTYARRHRVEFTEYNAQGDPSLITQLADKIALETPGVVYALGTPMAKALQERIPDVLLVQGAVTDPVAAGLAESWERSGRRYIATSDLPPVDRQLALVRELSPTVHRLGVVYNPGEPNSTAVISRMRAAVAGGPSGLSLVERPVSSTSDVAGILASLAGAIDAIYVPPDNTVHAALGVVGAFATEQKLPLFATVDSALQQGAVATLGLDFRQLGREAAEMTARVLEGADPATMPIALNRNPTITVSRATAIRLGLNAGVLEGRAGVRLVD